ncbi:MAG: VOC family protein [Micropepsaceae bacterium]
MPPMITALDHIVLITPDLEAGIAAYRTVLAREPVSRSNASAIFTTGNTALELLGPETGGVTAALATQGEGLASLCFAVDDLARAHTKLERRGLNPGEIAGDHFRTDKTLTHGIRHFFIRRDTPLPASTAAAGAVAALDHVVIATPNPDRAAALYGARLGLHMALDRTNPAWGMRLMFFRCGDLIVEIAHRLDTTDTSAPDSFYGLTWRTDDLDAAHTRLAAAGLDVSNICTGRKPGSRVFSLKNGTLNVPTLFIGA